MLLLASAHTLPDCARDTYAPCPRARASSQDGALYDMTFLVDDSKLTALPAEERVRWVVTSKTAQRSVGARACRPY